MNSTVSYKKNVFYLIILTFIVRCIVAAAIELGNDEVYYYTYALQPDWNHFDHPPMVGLLIKFFTFNLTWLSDLSMRLGAIVCCAIATWLIFLCGKLIRNERTGWLAALLYNLSVYTSIISGLFILPDSPQVVFWLASLYLMLLLILRKENVNRNLLWLGLFIGLTTMSKVHGVFLWLGFGAYILFHDRSWLKNSYLYVSALITAVVVSPILIWNIQNDFITFRFHGERVEVNTFAININHFLQTFFGQILYNNPINIVLYIIAFVHLRKSNMPVQLKSLLLWLGLPIIVIITLISLFRATLPHWSGPGFIALMLLTAWVMDAVMIKRNNIATVLMKVSTSIIIIAIIGGVALINFYPGTLNPNKSNKDYGRFDFTLDMYGWKDFGRKFSEIRKEDMANNVMPSDAALVTENWFPAAHLLFYVAREQMDVKAIGKLNRLHKFAWLNNNKTDIAQGSNAYYIASSNFFVDPQPLYGHLFTDIKLHKTIASYRSGKVSRYFFIYILENAKENIVLTRPEIKQ